MPIVSRSTLKGWFLRLKKPLESQFHDFLDSYFHKNDSIPTVNINGLDGQLANIPTVQQVAQIDLLAPKLIFVPGAATYNVLAGQVLELVIVEHTSDTNIKIGTSTAGNEILEDSILANLPYLYRVDWYFKNAATIHFTGTFSAIIRLS